MPPSLLTRSTLPRLSDLIRQPGRLGKEAVHMRRHRVVATKSSFLLRLVLIDTLFPREKVHYVAGILMVPLKIQTYGLAFNGWPYVQSTKRLCGPFLYHSAINKSAIGSFSSSKLLNNCGMCLVKTKHPVAVSWSRGSLSSCARTCTAPKYGLSSAEDDSSILHTRASFGGIPPFPACGMGENNWAYPVNMSWNMLPGRSGSTSSHITIFPSIK